MSLGRILEILTSFQTFSLLLYDGDLWAVVFDVTIIQGLWLAEGSDDG